MALHRTTHLGLHARVIPRVSFPLSACLAPFIGRTPFLPTHYTSTTVAARVPWSPRPCAVLYSPFACHAFAGHHRALQVSLGYCSIAHVHVCVSGSLSAAQYSLTATRTQPGVRPTPSQLSQPGLHRRRPFPGVWGLLYGFAALFWGFACLLCGRSKQLQLLQPPRTS